MQSQMGLRRLLDSFGALLEGFDTLADCTEVQPEVCPILPKVREVKEFASPLQPYTVEAHILG